jgi:DNA repair exonuclease SbcCD ATPase subunit
MSRDMKPILISISLLCLTIAPAIAQSEASPDPRAGYTCTQILKLKPEKWANVYMEKVKDRSEVGEDLAYEAYGECHKFRNDRALAKLPKPIAQRIQQYRTYSQELRVASAMLTRAYAGGGTMYVHLARRNVVSDEELVQNLIQVQQLGGENANLSVKTKLSQLRTQLKSLDPNLPKNRKQLAEFEMEAEARSQYKTMVQKFEANRTSKNGCIGIEIDWQFCTRLLSR